MSNAWQQALKLVKQKNLDKTHKECVELLKVKWQKVKKMTHTKEELLEELRTGIVIVREGPIFAKGDTVYIKICPWEAMRKANRQHGADLQKRGESSWGKPSLTKQFHKAGKSLRLGSKGYVSKTTKILDTKYVVASFGNFRLTLLTEDISKEEPYIPPRPVPTYCLDITEREARCEFGLTRQEIYDAVNAQKLHFKENVSYGNVWLQLVRSEVRALAVELKGEDTVEKEKHEATLRCIKRKIKAGRREASKLQKLLKEIEDREVKLFSEKCSMETLLGIAHDDMMTKAQKAKAKKRSTKTKAVKKKVTKKVRKKKSKK